MTAEELASQVREIDLDVRTSKIIDALIRLIIRAAIAEEREACAALAESHGAEWSEAYCEDADTYDPIAASNVATSSTARAIAAAIRARTTLELWDAHGLGR